MQGLSVIYISRLVQTLGNFWVDVYDGSKNSNEVIANSVTIAGTSVAHIDANNAGDRTFGRIANKTIVAMQNDISFENSYTFNATYLILSRAKFFKKGSQVLAFAGINFTAIPRAGGILPFLFSYDNTFGFTHPPTQMANKSQTHATNPVKCAKLEVVEVADDKFFVYGTIIQDASNAFVGQVAYTIDDAYTPALSSVYPTGTTPGTMPFGDSVLGNIGLTRIVRHKEDNFIVCCGMYNTPSAPVNNLIQIWICQLVTNGPNAAVLVGSAYNANSDLPPDPNPTNSRFYAPDMVHIEGTDLQVIANRYGALLFRIDEITGTVTILDSIQFAPDIPSTLSQNLCHLKTGFSNGADNRIYHSIFQPQRQDPNIQELVISFTNGSSGTIPFPFNNFHMVIKVDIAQEKIEKVSGPINAGQQNANFNSQGPITGGFSESIGLEFYYRADGSNRYLSGMEIIKD